MTRNHTYGETESMRVTHPPVSNATSGADSKSDTKILACISALLGAIVAVLSRQAMNVDGISYLDIASAYIRHDWGVEISGYWSPLYSWLLAIFLSIPHSARTEFPIVHFVNLLCYLFAYFGFLRCWTELSRHVECSEVAGEKTFPSEWPVLWNVFGHVLFLYLFLQLIPAVSPDVLSAGFIFLAAAYALKWKHKQTVGIGEIAAFALVLALGFLAKAILFYFGVFLLATIAVQRGRRKIRPVLLAGSLFLLMILPWMLALHSQYAKWTLGFSGKLNYSWFVNGTEAGEFLEAGGTTLPFLPGPTIDQNLTTYAVRVVPQVTYWPWFEPVRAGHTNEPRFNVSQQLRVIRKNAAWLRAWFLIEFGAITLAMLAMWIAAGKTAIRTVLGEWALLIPIILIFGMYALVFIRSYRYVIAFTVILFGIGIGVVPIPRSGSRFARAVLIAATVMFALLNFPGTVLGMAQNARKSFVQPRVAEALLSTGVKPGAVIGVINGDEYFYWARLARVSVGAEIWQRSAGKFWHSSSDEQLRAMCAMKKAGATAIVGQSPAGMRLEGWSELEHTGYFVIGTGSITCPNDSQK